MPRRPPRSTRTDTIFPYSTPFRSDPPVLPDHIGGGNRQLPTVVPVDPRQRLGVGTQGIAQFLRQRIHQAKLASDVIARVAQNVKRQRLDRKSTRLNSSH